MGCETILSSPELSLLPFVAFGVCVCLCFLLFSIHYLSGFLFSFAIVVVFFVVVLLLLLFFLAFFLLVSFVVVVQNKRSEIHLILMLWS